MAFTIDLTSYINHTLNGLNLITEGKAGFSALFDLKVRVTFLGIAMFSLPIIFNRGIRERDWIKLGYALAGILMSVKAVTEIATSSFAVSYCASE